MTQPTSSTTALHCPVPATRAHPVAHFHSTSPAPQNSPRDKSPATLPAVSRSLGRTMPHDTGTSPTHPGHSRSSAPPRLRSTGSSKLFSGPPPRKMPRNWTNTRRTIVAIIGCPHHGRSDNEIARRNHRYVTTTATRRRPRGRISIPRHRNLFSLAASIPKPPAPPAPSQRSSQSGHPPSKAQSPAAT